jgi:hypothetical protein
MKNRQEAPPGHAGRYRPIEEASTRHRRSHEPRLPRRSDAGADPAAAARHDAIVRVSFEKTPDGIIVLDGIVRARGASRRRSGWRGP